jgi:hypothetical protein
MATRAPVSWLRVAALLTAPVIVPLPLASAAEAAATVRNNAHTKTLKLVQKRTAATDRLQGVGQAVFMG